MALVSGGSSTGVGTALIIESIIFGLLMAASATMMVVFTAMRKKLGVLLAYISLGISALYTTIVSITAMFGTSENCDYGYAGYSYYSYHRTCETVGMPAAVIVALIGAIIVSWLGAFLIALYFKMSKRVKLTLTN